jgi:hypothetical protein
MRPDSHVTLELRTPEERQALSFHTLRCEVASLAGDVTYHAGGTFDQPLRSGSVLGGLLTSAEAAGPELALEGLLRASHGADLATRGAVFRALVERVLAGLRRGESARLLAVRVKVDLARHFPSLVIHPATPVAVLDTLTAARFFGFDFASRDVLKAPDRHFLRGSAQMLSLLERETGDGRRSL